MLNVTIRQTIRAALGILGLGFVLLLLLMQWSASRMQSHMAAASGSLFPAALSSQEAEAAFQKITKRYSDAVLMQDKGALTQAGESAAALQAALDSITKRPDLSPVRQKQVSGISERFADLSARSMATYGKVVASSANLSAETQQSMAALAQEDKTMEAALHELRTDLSSDFQAELDAVDSWSPRQRTLGLILFFITGGCAVVLAIMVERRFSLPLHRLTQRLKDIAEGDGDLTKRLDVANRDELGEVGSSFNSFMDNLHGVIAQVAESAQWVAQSSEKFSDISQQIGANSEETSAQANAVTMATDQVNRGLQTVATATEQMSASIKEIAKNATEAAKVADGAMRTALETNAIVAKLGESSAEIGQVIKVITSIAQKTDLLALNATVEAARAGEVGAGFAVVANEVKELAKQTAAATEDISRKIEAIQADANSAVKAITTISGVIGQVNDISGTIATAVEEQSATTAEMSRTLSETARGAANVAQNIQGVAQAAQSTSHGATDSRKAAKSLAEMSTQLRELVARFKLEGNGHAPKRAGGSLTRVS